MLKSRAGLARAAAATHNLDPLKSFCASGATPTRSKLIRLRRKQPSGRRQAVVSIENHVQDSKDEIAAVTAELVNSTRQQQQHQYTCDGCQKAIKSDRYLLKACDKYWHETCLRCARCQSQLADLGASFYCKSDMYLCRRDYLEIFGDTSACAICEKLIRAQEMVMRAKSNVYHLDCFACQLCNLRFCIGDRFYLCENKIVCQYDYDEHILPIEKSLLEQAVNDGTTVTASVSHGKLAALCSPLGLINQASQLEMASGSGASYLTNSSCSAIVQAQVIQTQIAIKDSQVEVAADSACKDADDDNEPNVTQASATISADDRQLTASEAAS